MTLPIFQDPNVNLMLLQTKWSTDINPVLSKPWNQGRIIQGVFLASGNNVINHGLGRKLQGWIVTRMIGAFVQLYDLQNTNQLSDLTLILNSSGVGSIDLLVF